MYASRQRLRLTETNGVDHAIGARLRAERWKLGWSCERLAGYGDMTPMHLRFVEWGWARLPARNMVLLLEALERRPAWLFEGLFPEG